MVYKKERSGDPDYDDKQPPEFHAGQVVTAGDGVYITPQGGAVDVNGAHVNLADRDSDGDNRPTPGNVAKHSSTVQQYVEEDTPAGTNAVEADKDVVAKLKAGQEAILQQAEMMAAGTVDENSSSSQDENPTTNTSPAQTADSKPKTTTSTTKTTTK